MRIRFLAAGTLRVNFQLGDELSVGTTTPEIEAVLSASRFDGLKLAELVDEDSDEVITAVDHVGETATINRGRRGPRTTSLSG